MGRGADRLTLCTNWGQIIPVDRDLRVFRAGRFALGNGLHARLTAASASMENQDRSRAGAADYDCVGSHRRHVRRAGASAAYAPDAASPATDAHSDAEDGQFDGV